MVEVMDFKEYAVLIDEIKERVVAARYAAMRSVNREAILLYHFIGSSILSRQQGQGWGSKIVDKVSSDLREAFPDLKGFSRRNLLYMRLFALEYPDLKFVQEIPARLSWYHIQTLLDKVPDREDRLFYMVNAIQHGWSRHKMVHHIEQHLHKRQGRAISNFKDKLAPLQADHATNTLRDPYMFGFLGLSDEAHERDVEVGLVSHMQKFLLSLGEGFAFLGRQYHLEVGGDDFYIDLLFYHIKLRCFVVIELKDGNFKPEYAGKMNFYLSAVDDLLKHPADNPSIGLILCKSKNNVLAEYTLRDMTKPIGLAEYRLTESLPENIKGTLPSIEELEAELSKDFDTKREDGGE